MSSNLISDLIQINLIKGNIKNAIETKGQTVANFASYPASIENIVSGGNGVKQYDSLENMYADVSNAHNGDLATVYASTQAPITATTEFQVATFPQTVVLDEALSDYVEVRFQALDESVMFDCWGSLDSSRFSMDCYTDDGDIRIQYESQDGITYTRTRFMKNQEDISGNEVDFGLVIKFGSRWGSSEFNPAIGKFIIAGTTVFDGIFQYNGTNFNILPNVGLTASIDDVWDDKFYGNNGVQNGTLSQTTNLNLQQLKDRVNLYSNISSLSVDSSIDEVTYIAFNMDNVPSINLCNVSNVSNLFGYSKCKNVGDINIASAEQAYYTFSSEGMLSIKNIYTKEIKNTCAMFKNCRNLISVPNFNTSKVEDMSQMFYQCYNLTNTTSIPNFDTSNVTNVSQMFYYSGITSIPNFNTSKVKDMSQAFVYCRNLASVPNLDTSNVTNMDRIFVNSYNLVNIPVLNMCKVTHLNNAFTNCNLSDNSISNIANSLPMASQLQNILVINTGLILNKLSNTDKNTLFNKGYLDCDLNTQEWSTKYNIYNGSTWVLYDRGDDFDRVGLTLKDIIKNTYNNTTNITIKSDGLDNGILFVGKSLFYYTNISNTINLQINTSNLFDTSLMFMGAGCRTITNFNTSNVTNMSSMFNGCSNLTAVPNFNTNKVKDMTRIFGECRKLTSVPNFDTSNVTKMGWMFNGCSNLTAVPNFNTSKVTVMSNTFMWCRKLTSVPNFDTSNVTNMSWMFGDCSNLTSVPNFNTSNVIDMTAMLYDCNKITSIPNFDTSNVIYASEMCRNSSIVRISNFDFRNVVNVYYAFANCYNLTDVCNLNLCNARITARMFQNCPSLKNIGSIILNNARGMYDTEAIFAECTNLTNAPHIEFGNFYDNDISWISLGAMFGGCVNLRNVPQYNIPNGYSVSQMFAGCNNLSNASIQNIVNMCLNMNITNKTRTNLTNTNQWSPFYGTKFDNSYYQNRWAELDAAGWSY